MATGSVNPKKGKVVDIPDEVPTIGTATAGTLSASVAFTAPTITPVGGPITKYFAVSNPGNITSTGASSPITVSGLTGGQSYTFTVAAGNATGRGVASSASNSVTIANIVSSIESLVIAGGGGGGGPSGGGGGAGGVKYNSAFSVIGGTTYSVTVGDGGALNTNGSNSVFGSETATGGGCGGASTIGSNGGSGGGGAGYNTVSRVGGTGIAGQGKSGGTGDNGPYRGGGGGGASTDGASSNNTSTGAGNGGVGTSAYSAWGAATSSGHNVGGTYYFAGGGGGGGYWNEYGFPQPTGGYGGGATGASRVTNSSTALANTGGGGGGSSDSSGAGSAGASGIVIIRYPDTYPAATTATNATTVTSGGYRYYKWTSNGSIVF